MRDEKLSKIAKRNMQRARRNKARALESGLWGGDFVGTHSERLVMGKDGKVRSIKTKHRKPKNA